MMEARVAKKVDADCSRLPMKYTMMTKTTGRMQSIGRSASSEACLSQVARAAFLGKSLAELTDTARAVTSIQERDHVPSKFYDDLVQIEIAAHGSNKASMSAGLSTQWNGMLVCLIIYAREPEATVMKPEVGRWPGCHTGGGICFALCRRILT